MQLFVSEVFSRNTWLAIIHGSGVFRGIGELAKLRDAATVENLRVAPKEIADAFKEAHRCEWHDPRAAAAIRHGWVSIRADYSNRFDFRLIKWEQVAIIFQQHHPLPR